MNNSAPDNLKTSVLEKIKTGQATMRPKWHFFIPAVLAFLGLVAASCLLVFLASLVFFVLYQSGAWFAPEFGPYGLRIFFESLPWALLGLALVCLIIVEMLARRYAFGYERPLLYSATVILSLTVCGGVLLAKSPIHPSLLNRAYDSDRPVVKKIYRDIGLPRLAHVHSGRIIGFTDGGIVIASRHNGTTTVMITPQTRFPEGLDMIEGDLIMVLGDLEHGLINAFGIRKIEPKKNYMQKAQSDRPGFYPAVISPESQEL